MNRDIFKRRDKIYIAPSVLSADFLRLGEEIESVVNHGADIIHFDVMDGNFVPNISFGIPVLESVARIKDKHKNIMLDVHLMIEKPERYIKEFSSAGADMISFHIEATYHPYRVLDMIKSDNKIAGIAINPGTPVQLLTVFLPELDFVLVMTVNPGFGGQKIIKSMLSKITELDATRREMGYSFLIEADGGLNDENVVEFIDAGTDILVFGSFIFSGDRKDKIETIKNLISTRRDLSKSARYGEGR